MQFVDKSISIAELKVMSENMFGGLVKAVVDISQRVMVVDASLHVDEEYVLLEKHGAAQEALWGINLHPDQWGSRSRGVDDPVVQEHIRVIVNQLVKP